MSFLFGVEKIRTKLFNSKFYLSSQGGQQTRVKGWGMRLTTGGDEDGRVQVGKVSLCLFYLFSLKIFNSAFHLPLQRGSQKRGQGHGGLGVGTAVTLGGNVGGGDDGTGGGRGWR